MDPVWLRAETNSALSDASSTMYICLGVDGWDMWGKTSEKRSEVSYVTRIRISNITNLLRRAKVKLITRSSVWNFNLFPLHTVLCVHTHQFSASSSTIHRFWANVLALPFSRIMSEGCKMCYRYWSTLAEQETIWKNVHGFALRRVWLWDDWLNVADGCVDSLRLLHFLDRTSPPFTTIFHFIVKACES